MVGKISVVPVASCFLLTMLLVLHSLPKSSIARTQESPEESRAAKLLRIAETGSPVVRPQAAERFVVLGATAVEELARQRKELGRDLEDFGPDLIEVLGRLPSESLRLDLWSSVEDPEFPWRPAASRSIATTAKERERAKFLELLQDPLAAVRAAALRALETLGKPAVKTVKPLLSDPDARVRRAAAQLLDLWGERWALAWLFQELQRTDRYFEEETGKAARFAALKILNKRLGSRFGYRADLSPDLPENRVAYEKLLTHWKELVKGPIPDLPRVAQAGPRIEGVRLGLEVRSCRKGELALRWTDRDELLIGRGNPRVLPLPPGTVKRLESEARSLLLKGKTPRFTGKPGCDLESYRWNAQGEPKTLLFVVSKGSDPEKGLRPSPLQRLARLMISSIESSSPTEDPSNPTIPASRPAPLELRSRLIAALESVGGTIRP